MKKTIFRLTFWTVLLLACILCRYGLTRGQTSQQAAERFANGKKYEQWTFLLEDQVDQKQAERFYMTYLDTIASSLGINAEEESLAAWSGSGHCPVYSDRRNTDAEVIATGGDFFAFHPQKLLDGSYYYEGEDLMSDYVVLDAGCAWDLFGSTQVAGLTVRLENTVLQIRGVVEGEEKKLYMPLSTAETIFSGQIGASCIEAVIPNPVKGYAERLMNLSSGTLLAMGEQVKNTGRFSFLSSCQKILHLLQGKDYRVTDVPQWEQEARTAENRLMFLAVLTIICLIPLARLLVVLLWRTGKRLVRSVQKLIPAQSTVKDHRYNRSTEI